MAATPRGGTAVRVAVALLVLASVVAVSTAALAASGGATAPPDALAAERASGAADAPGAAVGGESSTAATNDTVEVVVRFQEARETVPARAGSVEGLKNHARKTQAPFRRFVARTPGVERRQDFWLANAVLVEVDPERVSMERLLEVEYVTRVHRNYEVNVSRRAPSPTPAGGDAPALASGTVLRTAGGHTLALAGDALSTIGGDALATAGGDVLSTAGGDALAAAGIDSNATAVGEEPLATATSSSTNSDYTYGLEMVNASAAWHDLGTRGGGVDVAILDTGADPNHQDVDVDGWAEFDDTGGIVSEGPEHAYDSQYHGTHVAGTVLGGAATGTHIGVAPNASHHHGLVLPGGSGTYSQIVAGMQWAADDVDADVLSMSLGTSSYTDFVDPVRNARSSGTFVVAAIGNDGEDTSGSPGNIYDSVSVGAVDDQRLVASFSGGETIVTDDAWGSTAPADWPDSYTVPQVSAPGVEIVSAYATDSGDEYALLDGTSMATPHVAGSAALLVASDPGANVSEVERRLVETAIHPDGADARDHRYGHGVIDVYRASRNATVSGTVTGPDGESAIENATVTLTGDETATATTDADGAYVVDGLSPVENLSVTGDATDYHSASASLDLATGESATQHFSLDPKAGAIEGTVTDADTGEGVANASVELATGEGEQVSTNGTGPNGSYAFEAVRVGDDYVVSIDDARYEPATVRNVSVAANDTATVGFQLEPRPGAIAGSASDGVTDDPVENATVTLTNASSVEIGVVETGADGGYAFENLSRADGYELSVSAANYDDWNGTVDVGPGETVDRNAALDPHDGSLEGVVTGAVTSDAIANATVDVALGGDETVTVRTAGDGGFAIDPVPRAENYSVSVGHDRYEPASVAVTVGPGEAVQRNVSATPSPGTIEGVVTDRNGTPLSGATVGLDTADVEPAVTGADGSYELSGVPAEVEHVLNASARAYRHNASVNATLRANGSATRSVAIEQRATYFGVEPLDAPDSAVAGDGVTVTATVSNLGTDDWADETVLRVDGEPVANETVSLNASNATVVAFEPVLDDAGTSEIAVATSDESATATVEVEAPSGGGLPAPPASPDVSVVDRQLRSDTVAPGEPVAVAVTLRNAGDADGSVDLSLTADGAVLATATVAVPAGSTAETTLVGELEGPGTYDLAVDGADAGVVTVTGGGADVAGAAGVAGNESADVETNASTNASTNESTSDEEPTESASADGSPGFGVGAGVVAVLVATALVARRRRSPRLRRFD